MEERNVSSRVPAQGVLKVVYSIAPWLVGALLFFVVCYHFYAPQFDGKSLSQGDIAQYAGMSKDIKEHRKATGKDPQWTGNMFSGMPAYLIDIEYPEQYVKQAASPLIKSLDGPMNMTLWAMVLMMVAVVLMGVNPWLGIIAALAYGLSTYFFLIIDAGHITKMWALVYAPPLVGAVWYALRRNIWIGAALAALFGSLELGANHPQITYYFLLACVSLWLCQFVVAWREKALKTFGLRTAVLALAALLAVGSNIAPLWYTVEHQKYTTRGSSEATSEEDSRQSRIGYNTAWSYGIAESFNMLVPNYMGSWSGDFNMEAAEILQSPSAQNALFNISVDKFTEELSKDYPGVRRADVLTLLEAEDEGCIAGVEAIYDSYARKAWNYTSNYWGDQPYTAGPTYLGAAVILLAILGLMLLQHREVVWIVAVSLFALLLAWGANVMGFYELMYDILPGYSSFRTVSMALVVVEWSIPLLAVMALCALIKSDLSAKILLRKVAIAVGIIVAMVVAMVIVADYGIENIYAELGDKLWVEQLREAVYNSRHAALVADVCRSMIIVVITAAIVAVYVILREKWQTQGRPTKILTAITMVAVGIIIVWDLAGVAERYLGEDKWLDKAPTELMPTEADKQILEDKELGFRVLDLNGDPFTSARASYFHRSVGGYHGAKLGRYQDVIDRYLNHYDEQMLAALNTRYVLYDGEALPVEYLTGVEPYGAAWFVGEVARCETTQMELQRIGEVDLRNVAVVSCREEGLSDYYDTSGAIELVEYAPNRLRYDYTAPEEALAVFSEVYFPEGWSVTIDGEPAEYFAADYVLRGMVLPTGEHSVVWSFEAPRWGLISTIMAISAVAILLALVAVALLYKRLEKYGK
ncbi:MAG: hypothetical protein J6Q95_04795 [Alistipes sp.]|nr:hypothetical protein [Alistipes sp.]